MSHNDIVHRLYGPLFGWGFMVIWMSMLGVAIYTVTQDGLPGQMDPQIEIGIFGIFVVFGIFATMSMFYEPLVFLKVTAGNITIKQVWLFKTRIYKGRLSDCPYSELLIDEDSDGDPYYRAIITPENQDAICFFQSHTKENVEKVVTELNARITKYKS